MNREHNKEDKELESILKPISTPDKYITSESESNYLETGWYYISDSLNGTKRELDKMENEIYYLDTIPILTHENFSKLQLYKSNFDKEYIGLAIYFDDHGTLKWKTATEKSVGKNLALVINNVLIECPRVNSTITTGVSAINRDVYTPEEIIMFKRLLEEQTNGKENTRNTR